MFWKGSSAGAISPQKIASLCFQTSQQRGRKIHASSRPFGSDRKILPPCYLLTELETRY